MDPQFQNNQKPGQPNNGEPYSRPQQPPYPQQAPYQNQQQTYQQPYQQPSQQDVPGGVSSYDYLDSIATKQKKPLGFSLKQLIFLAGGLVAVIIFIALAALFRSSGSPNLSTQGYTTYAQSESLAEVAKTAQKDLNSRDLVPLNGSLVTQLNSTHSELGTFLEDSGLPTKKIPKDIVKEQNNEELLDKIEDARLEGVLDRVYVREMTYELQTLIFAIDSMSAKLGDGSQRSQLESISRNLQSLQKQLSEYQEV